jgi:hypothetical protein
MNPTPDITTADNGGNFDPRHAAALLDQTTQQARRRIEPFPPWLLAVRAVMALGIYGAIWLSVRGQHPYHWPTASVIPVAVVLGVVNYIATVTVAKRATAGVSGRTRLRPADIALWAAVWVGMFVVMMALAISGLSDAIVYGIYPAAVPLIVAGLAWASITAARAEWRACCTAAAVAAVGVVGAFAGPARAWAVAGVGLFAVMLGTAAVIAWRQRRSAVRS